eukprot:TRINITY_DN5106_c0_g1_i2.p1 TRINITY_DN5106_c0_g1~~TRINITY_DN5106_c0_g1_i2.p1  ORF type:complete len:253 (-),score=31.19 TRINITY_DN5106_c0_g1_i2:220-978(-)
MIICQIIPVQEIIILKMMTFKSLIFPVMWRLHFNYQGRQEYPSEICGAPPVVYVTQIYAIVKDRTQVDREIDQMRNKNEIKLLQLPENDHVVVDTEDYRTVVENQLIKCGDKDRPFLMKFKGEIVEKFKSAQVSKRELEEFFKESNEDAISILLRCGLLARGVGGHFADIFYFTFQGLGKSAAAIGEGRDEICKLLKRRRHGEMTMKQFENFKFKGQKWCGINFHLRDLIGKGLVEMFSSPIGEGIRLVRRG